MGHYLDLGSAVGGFTLFPIGYLLHAFAQRKASVAQDEAGWGASGARPYQGRRISSSVSWPRCCPPVFGARGVGMRKSFTREDASRGPRRRHDGSTRRGCLCRGQRLLPRHARKMWIGVAGAALSVTAGVLEPEPEAPRFVPPQDGHPCSSVQLSAHELLRSPRGANTHAILRSVLTALAERFHELLFVCIDT